MPLPAHALTVTGGCNCRRIVYRIQIPALADRPLHPNYDPTSGLSRVHQPYIFTDLCNDCRRATGSIIPASISGPLDYVSVSISRAPNSSEQVSDAETGESRHWIPAREVFANPTTAAKGDFTLYNSSAGKYRSFCSNCGTNLTFWEEQLPDMLDVYLGTVDREFLESEDMVPERHLWWDIALPWVRRFLDRGDGGEVERHVGADMQNRSTGLRRADIRGIVAL